MRLKLSYGQQELLSRFPDAEQVSVEQVLTAVQTSHPEIYQRWCDADGQLRKTLNVFINGEHVRYRDGLNSILKAGDEIYIVPLITGG